MYKLPAANIRKNEIRWVLSTSTYPMDAVYGACYVWIAATSIWTPPRPAGSR